MNEKDKKRISKFLSLVLRHQPEYINIIINEKGWVNILELINNAKTKNFHFSKDELKEIVETNDKQRFAFNEDYTQIRANQGHSLVAVDLELEVTKPPGVLYHGTVGKFIDSIKNQGLKKRSRQHVHLSAEINTAVKVGSRRGKPIILTVDSDKMYKEGFEFFQSKNGVWLTNKVPFEFIDFNKS